MIKFDSLILLFYGLIVAIGGLMGYIKANSLPSLLMGTLFGVILIACSFALWRKKLAGFWGGIASSIILAIFFMTRYALTGNFFPPGALALLSIIIMILLISTRDTNRFNEPNS